MAARERPFRPACVPGGDFDAVGRQERMQARDSQSVPPQLPAGDWGTGPAPAVTVELENTRVVNYAMQQNDVPVVTRLRIANAGDASLRDLHVRITTDPGFSAPWELHLAELRPGKPDLGVVDRHSRTPF